MNISATKRQIANIIARDELRFGRFGSVSRWGSLRGVTFRGPLSNAHEYFTQMAKISKSYVAEGVVQAEGPKARVESRSWRELLA